MFEKATGIPESSTSKIIIGMQIGQICYRVITSSGSTLEGVKGSEWPIPDFFSYELLTGFWIYFDPLTTLNTMS